MHDPQSRTRRAMLRRAFMLRCATDAARRGDAEGSAILRADARNIMREIRGGTMTDTATAPITADEARPYAID